MAGGRPSGRLGEEARLYGFLPLHTLELLVVTRFVLVQVPEELEEGEVDYHENLEVQSRALPAAADSIH